MSVTFAGLGSASAVAAVGDLDETFGDHGIVRTDVPAGYLNPTSVVVEPDGKLVAAFSSTTTAVVIRLDPNGSLDTSFGEGGIATIPGCPFTKLGLLANGGIQLARIQPAGNRLDLCRLNASGALDREFLGDGMTSVTLYMFTEDVAIEPDGSTLVFGDGPYGRAFADSEYIVVKLRPDATVDPAFSGDGVAEIDTGGGVTAGPFAVAPDGKILLGGERASGIDIVRLNPDGTVDGTFGVAGNARLSLVNARSFPGLIVPIPDGRIAVLLNNSRPDRPPVPTTVRMLLPDGSIDTSYASGGDLTLPDGFTYPQVLVQSDSKLILKGTAIYRFDANGRPDQTFSETGMVNPVVRGLAGLQPDGRIVLAWMAQLRTTSLARIKTTAGPANADADAYLDDDDACPRVYGPSNGGCPEIRRHLSLQYNQTTGRFEGTIAVPNDACRSRVSVNLYRARPGADRKVATAVSGPPTGPTPSNPVAFKRWRTPGRYYISVPTQLEPQAGFCLSARSRSVSVGG